MITIRFFAQIRELVGTSELTLEADGLTISQLLYQLAQRGDKWTMALKEKTVLCAANKQLVDYQYLINNGDEIAFFPPVTGG
ncbi:molybdopterin synthase sulfur carrier subunit [Candidatus Schmidhempelia bombi]|jgi:sulfur-carrier protein|uniref:Molybdopterin synthase sulfur carrier subunit n=1 Tax=Candidatus Schmidhempelia bombi str. Bimp TaxID=1387197 RepID=A0AB94IE36_9GAMM|nr:molybdopterin synthase sulfur carrier subunit [Candidatus Schmidhempelia bombi]TEA27728.1 molybdopterin synthase sulfur carrier subunit [Candidatus Schmidhempelia bombi str. Bimp]